MTLDRAITFAPSGDVVVAALASLRKGGKLVAVNAIHLDRVPEFDYNLLWGERQIRSVANMTRADARDFLNLAAQIKLRPRADRLLSRSSQRRAVSRKERRHRRSARHRTLKVRQTIDPASTKLHKLVYRYRLLTRAAQQRLPSRDCEGVSMGLRRTKVDEKPVAAVGRANLSAARRLPAARMAGDKIGRQDRPTRSPRKIACPTGLFNRAAT